MHGAVPLPPNDCVHLRAGCKERDVSENRNAGPVKCKVMVRPIRTSRRSPPVNRPKPYVAGVYFRPQSGKLPAKMKQSLRITKKGRLLDGSTKRIEHFLHLAKRLPLFERCFRVIDSF